MKITKDKLFSIVLIIILALLVIKPPIDPDFGWHYKYGEYIFNNQRILKENLYSFNLPDYKWANSYWLAELIIYAMFSFIGAVGTTFLFNVTLLTFLIFVMARNSTRSTKVVLGTILSLIISYYAINVRPLYFSSLFILIQTYILLEKPKYIYYLPLLYLLWGNIHPDFIPGLSILGLYAFFALAPSSFTKKKLEWKKMFWFFLLGLACFGITIINPYGIGLWVTLLKEANNATFGTILEVSPFSLNTQLEGMLYYYLSLGVFLAGVFFSRKKLPLWYLVAFIFYFIAGTSAQYFHRIFFLLGLFGLKTTLETIITKIPPLNTKITSSPMWNIYKYGLLLSLILIILELISLTVNPNIWENKYDYPYTALEYIKKANLKGNMYNTYNYGGHLILHLPEYKTFIDGRMASWKDQSGNYILQDYIKIRMHPYENELLLKYYFEKDDISWAFDYTKAPIIAYLQKELNWQIQYQDSVNTVLVKN